MIEKREKRRKEDENKKNLYCEAVFRL